MAEIEIEIDGRKLTARSDQTVIQVADDAGIYIPRFCYHKHLSIAANCRMCLVEVEKSPKTLPACATPVTAGMKVFTKSPKTVEAQRAVMEFLLINHPLDCPICDQGGECELQDLSMGYGASASHYDECKRSVPDLDLGPLIATEMTRCIYCTRCVRFGEEVAGMREMGATGRGEDTEIGTYIQHAIHSEVSGNIIDLCPVGALTSKPYRFTARAWELDQAPGISPHDCIGSNLNIHTRYGTVMRVAPRENAELNETWISDRDRYSYAGLYHHDRLDEPLVKINGKWEVVEWQKALEIAALGLHETITEHGADKFGALASPNSTLEEFYLLQKIVRGLGSSHIDHRLREVDVSDQAQLGAFPGFSLSLAEMEQCDAILLIGSNIQKELPLAALRVRKASLKGASILTLNPIDYAFNFNVNTKKIVAPHLWIQELTELLQALQSKQTNHTLVQALQGKKKICIVLGLLALHHPQAATIRYLAKQIAELTSGKLNMITDGANSAGAWLAGAIPHRHAGGADFNHVGMHANEMLKKPRKAYLFVNVEPDLDCANAHLASEALKQAKCVVALSSYRNPLLDAHAHVILPMAPFTETSGTFVNALGVWQSFSGMAKPLQSTRPAWKILRALGNFLHLNDFAYESSEEVRHEIKNLIDKMPNFSMEHTVMPAQALHKSSLSRIGEIPIYAVDSLVRRSQPLQKTQEIMEGELAAVRIHPDTAQKLGLQDKRMVKVKQESSEVELPVIFDKRVALDAVSIAGGLKETAMLGDLFGEVEIV